LGGTGKFTNATGKIDYFGIADFKEKDFGAAVQRKGLPLKKPARTCGAAATPVTRSGAKTTY